MNDKTSETAPIAMTNVIKEALRSTFAGEDFLGEISAWRSRKTPRHKSHALEYRVAWTQERRRFDVFRGAVLTASFSTGHRIAVGLALLEAKREAAHTGQKVIVTSMRDGRRIVEWDGITPA